MRERLAPAAIALGLLAVAVSGCGLSLSGSHFSGQPAGSLKVPNVELVADDGRPFRFSELRGTAYMLFFGFTHCLDTCPLTLAKLERARESLPADEKRSAVVVFATVDPGRDKPAHLHAYLHRFGPGMVGVTGTNVALKTLDRGLGVWAQRLSNGPNYDMSHTTTIYFVDAGGSIRTLHDSQDSQRELNSDLAELVR